MKKTALFVSIIILLSIFACSEAPELIKPPPPGGQTTSRIVLAEMFTETG